MKRALSLLVLAITAIAFWLTLERGNPLPAFNTAETEPTLTQNYLTNATLWRYDEAGLRSSTLWVERAVQFTDRPARHMTGLRFEGQDKDGRAWVMTAGAGRLHPIPQELHLFNDVIIKEAYGQGVLETPRLRVKLKQQRADNMAPVTLTLNNSVTTATGLDVDLQSGMATLKRNVETVYGG